eukprot:scaffold66272_cov21-Tisochrysis_lutea.AAC.1
MQVARDEGLYEYTTDTRAGCTVFEGSKQLLLTLGRFVVVVSEVPALTNTCVPGKHVATVDRDVLCYCEKLHKRTLVQASPPPPLPTHTHTNAHPPTQVTHEVSGDVGARSATVHILDLKHRLVAGSLSTGLARLPCLLALNARTPATTESLNASDEADSKCQTERSDTQPV